MKFRIVTCVTAITLFAVLAIPIQLAAQQHIIGELRLAKSDFPSHQIMIVLQFSGSQIKTTYSDSKGNFGFDRLVGGEYHIIINDEAYDPVDERIILHPYISTHATASITLRRRESAEVSGQARASTSGSNSNMVDLREYNRHFPKKAIKEYDNALDADRAGEHEQAISHYQTALQIAPDYYPAHNNLGSDYLSKAHFASARKEFEEVVRLNQSDAAAYLNLSNVCMLMGQMADAEKYLGEGMRREPDSALGHFLLGSLDIRTGKLQEAEVALRHAIQLSPAMAQPRLQLVNLLLQQDRKSDAATQLHEFVSAFPNDPSSAHARQLLQKLEPVAKSAAAPN